MTSGRALRTACGDRDRRRCEVWVVGVLRFGATPRCHPLAFDEPMTSTTGQLSLRTLGEVDQHTPDTMALVLHRVVRLRGLVERETLPDRVG
jgi:hypothetical protein